jgi:hypothetical protein
MEDYQPIELDSGTVMYSITDTIEETNRVHDEWVTNSELRRQMQGLGLKRPIKLDPRTEVYPQKPSYTFQEFAGAVFEIGSFGDMIMVDPCTLKTLWVGGAFDPARSIYDAMRRVLDVAEKVGFLGTPPEEDEIDESSSIHRPSNHP